MSSVNIAESVYPLDDPYAIPLDKINVSDPELFRSNRMWPY